MIIDKDGVCPNCFGQHDTDPCIVKAICERARYHSENDYFRRGVARGRSEMLVEIAAWLRTEEQDFVQASIVDDLVSKFANPSAIPDSSENE